MRVSLDDNAQHLMLLIVGIWQGGLQHTQAREYIWQGFEP